MIRRLLISMFLLQLPATLWAASLDALDHLYSPELETEPGLLLDRVNNHARNTEFDYALKLSDSLIESIDALRVSTPTIYGQVLVNRGIILSASENYDEAMRYINRGIEFMEARTNPFSRVLIPAIMAKAITELSMDDLVTAEDSFRRAQHITHRQGGVYTEDQLAMISYLTITHLKQGQARAADTDQLFSLRVAEKVYGPDAIELLPTLDRIGNYFTTRGSALPIVEPMTVDNELKFERDDLFKQAVDMHMRAVTIIEQNYGDNDLRLVQPLRALARARMLQITNRKYAEAALERSLEIIQSNPESDNTDRAQALVDLADLYTITSDRRASEVYLQAWHMLQEQEETRQLANNLFGSPTRLLPRENHVLFIDRWPDAATPGDPLFVNIEYNVTPVGTVNRVTVVDKNVPNEQVRVVRQRIRTSKFRPRIVDGEIKQTENLTLYQPFKVLRQIPQQFKESFDENGADSDEERGSGDDSTLTGDEVT